MKTSDIFSPFEDWSDGNETYFGLCIKDGKLFVPNPDATLDSEFDFYHEWHIEKYGDSWLIECGYAENASFEVYRGNIPNREFFVEVMKNVEEGFDVTTAKYPDQMMGGIGFPYTPLLFQDTIGGNVYNEDEFGIRHVYFRPETME